MKIGIYSGEIPPPVFINNLINGLADKGDIVFIYGKVIEKEYNFLNSGIIQRKIPARKIGVILYFIYLLIRLIIEHPYTYMTMVRIVKYNSKNWKQYIYRACRVFPPFLDNLDIFHIQWAKTLVQYPEFTEKLNCPVILSLRGAHINYSPLADKNLAQRYMRYFPMVTAFHSVSNAISIEAKKYGADPDKITLIYPAVKNKLINTKELIKTHKSDKLLQIISIGRCHWKKGYAFALDAMAILKKDGVQFHYTIIAAGRDHENISYHIHDLGLIEYVSFINGLPHNEALIQLSKSNIFLLPSLEEGISNAVLEAMALEVPVISTDCGGMGEVIRNTENGFLVPSRDPNSMALMIKKFINLDESSKLSIIQNSKETIVRNHLLPQQIHQYRLLYNKCL